MNAKPILVIYIICRLPNLHFLSFFLQFVCLFVLLHVHALNFHVIKSISIFL